MPNKSHARKFNPEVTLDDAGAVLIEFCDGTNRTIYVAEALTIKRRLIEILGKNDGGEGEQMTRTLSEDDEKKLKEVLAETPEQAIKRMMFWKNHPKRELKPLAPEDKEKENA